MSSNPGTFWNSARAPRLSPVSNPWPFWASCRKQRKTDLDCLLMWLNITEISECSVLHATCTHKLNFYWIVTRVQTEKRTFCTVNDEYWKNSVTIDMSGELTVDYKQAFKDIYISCSKVWILFVCIHTILIYSTFSDKQSWSNVKYLQLQNVYS